MISEIITGSFLSIHKIPVNHEIKELQKIATLCAVHILRKVLMYGTRISDGKQL